MQREMQWDFVCAFAVVLLISGCGRGSSGGNTDGGAEEPVVAWGVGTGGDRGLILTSRDRGQSWTIAQQFPLALNGIDFVGDSDGWAVGSGLIVHTSDGGSTWVTQREGEEDLRDVFFVTATHGLAVGRAAPTSGTFGTRIILVTDDGGVQWRAAPIDTQGHAFGRTASLSHVCVTDAGVGLTAGSGVDGDAVLVSRDAGASWTDVTTRVPGGSFSASACGRGANLWVAAFGPRLFHSSDGGTTWEDASGPLIAALEGAVQDFVFLDDQHGWASGSDATEHPAVLRTDDAGGTWQRIPLPGTALGGLTAIAFASASTGIAVGHTAFRPPAAIAPIAFATTDSGGAWLASSFTGIVEGHLLDVALVTSE